MVMTVKVEGEVRVRDGSNLTTEFYEREFDIDDVENEGIARSVVRKALLGEDLRRTVRGFKSIRTMRVVDLSQKKGKKTEVTKLERLMAEAIKEDAVPDGLDQYGSADSKVAALERSLAKKRSPFRRPDDGVEDLGYID